VSDRLQARQYKACGYKCRGKPSGFPSFDSMDKNEVVDIAKKIGTLKHRFFLMRIAARFLSQNIPPPSRNWKEYSFRKAG